MKVNSVLLFGLLFSSLIGLDHNDKDKIMRCGYDEVIKSRILNNPIYYDIYDQTFQRALEFDNYTNRDIIYQLPIVFHIVYNDENQNIPDYVIENQLIRLNEDFRRLNENAIETRPEFLQFAGDSEVEFYLATIDPDGNPTTGITHNYTSRSGFPSFSIMDLFTGNMTLDEVKSSVTGGVDPWDTYRYINVWICNIEASFLGQILGFAYPPLDIQFALDNIDLEDEPDWSMIENTLQEELQGIVLHYTTIGPDNPQANIDGISANDLGRTLVHEMGHYLGLRHIWGDPDLFSDGCSVDDGIVDTPNQSSQSNFECNLENNTCVDNPINYPDMVENYMDYSNDQCLNMFTLNQISVMRAVIEFARSGLIENMVDCIVGDINLDEELNILDVVLMVNHILSNESTVPCGEINGDGIINILDIVQLVQIILNQISN